MMKPATCKSAVTFGLWVTTSTAYTPNVSWCPDCSPFGYPNTVDCGRISVPMNWAEPDGKSIELFLTRLKSSEDYENKAAGLYVETGGPGQPNSNFTIQQMQNNTGGNTDNFQELHRKFDIIGVDMRGTGFSYPVNCSYKAFNDLTWPAIHNKNTYEDMVSKARDFGQSCLEKSGDLLQYVGTDQAIQDFEAVRQALKHDKMNYLGFSYGTTVGYYYAETYPDKVGRMVLDGVTNNYLSAGERITTGAFGFDAVMTHFFEWCDSSKDCALHGQNITHVWNTILDRAATGVIAVNKTIPMYDWEIISTLPLLMHDGTRNISKENKSFQTAASKLSHIYVTNDASVLKEISPPPPTDTISLMPMSEYAINCADRDNRSYTFEDFENIYTVSEVLGPITRGGISTQTRSLSVCEGWPTNATNFKHRLNEEQMMKAPPILLVNSFYDTATPFQWGLSMRDEIPTGVSIYRDGAGHTSWLHQGDTTEAERKFLVDGIVPKDGQVFKS